MKTKIKINQVFDEPSWRFNIVVEEGGKKTKHSVSMSKDFYESLGVEVAAWKVIETSFRFLLDHEPKESILSKFDITVISHYFPEFKEQLMKKLKNKKGQD